MAVPVRGTSAFEAGAPQSLFESRVAPVGARDGIDYAVTADGRRFLIVCAAEQTSAAPITVVLNWAAELSKNAKR